MRKSKEKLKIPSPPKKTKPSSSVVNKPKPKRSKKQKPTKIFPQPFLDSMATKIQKVWRGYIVRKQFKE
jgi:hypothetical protein